MNITIVGAGEIGCYLATFLSQESHSVSLIERDPVLAEELNQSLDAKVIAADGAGINALLDANINECELFLAATSSNATNLVASSMANKLGAKQVVCRIDPSLQREEWLFDFKGTFGVDYFFSPQRLSAIELAKYVRNPNSLLVEEIARGRIELQQVEVAKDSTAVGKTLLQLKAPERSRVAMIARGAKSFVPDADTVIESGDIVTIFGEPRKIQTLVKQLLAGQADGEGPRVVIFGGGEYGFSLAEILENWNCRVRIFEKSKELCKKLVERLNNTTIINADATLAAELKEEQIEATDFFIAANGSDEDNVMSCLQAHTLGAKNCLTLIHRADYASAIRSSGRYFGIAGAVSPREATRREIERFITTDPFHLVKKFDGGEVLEISVVEKSVVIGQSLREIKWPPRCVLVGLIRNAGASVPGPDDVLKAGDLVYAMTSQDSKKALIKLLS